MTAPTLGSSSIEFPMNELMAPRSARRRRAGSIDCNSSWDNSLTEVVCAPAYDPARNPQPNSRTKMAAATTIHVIDFPDSAIVPPECQNLMACLAYGIPLLDPREDETASLQRCQVDMRRGGGGLGDCGVFPQSVVFHPQDAVLDVCFTRGAAAAGGYQLAGRICRLALPEEFRGPAESRQGLNDIATDSGGW